jgi:ribose/xylose/arabinose/galactoside ABC-type transport system permease subunit
MPAWFRDFGDWKVLQFAREDGTTYGLSVMAVVFLLAAVVTAGLLKHTMLGRKIYALGGNPVAAARAGVDVLLVQMFVYGYMGFLAGIAGIVHTLDVQAVAPNALVGKELGVFAAVVLGGASLTGGVGTAKGTVLGVALIAIMSNGLTLARVPADWDQTAIGLVILVSVTLAAYRERKAEKGRLP